MGGIDQELHLLLVHLAARPPPPVDDAGHEHGHECRQVEQVGQGGAVPGWRHPDGDDLRFGIGAGSQRPYFYLVRAGLQVGQLYGILAGRVLLPRALVDAVFEDDVLRVYIVEQRELQRY